MVAAIGALMPDAEDVAGVFGGRDPFDSVDAWDDEASDIGIVCWSICGGKPDIGKRGEAKSESKHD